jgi:type I restriction enzyme S subunit
MASWGSWDMTLNPMWTPLGLVAASRQDSFVDGPFGSNLKSSEYVSEGVRLIQLQNIGDGVWIDGNEKYISDVKFQTLKRHGAVPGDIAIAKMAEPVARACVLPAVAGQFVVVADCIKLCPDQDRHDSKFITYAINSATTRAAAERKSTGTTRLRINLSVLKTVEVWTPPLLEQRRIAEVLDTVDVTIRKAEQLIAKLQRAQQGLLHDLLTRGVDDNGELRDPERHPEQFKDSALGRIPVAWRIYQLHELADIRSGIAKNSNRAVSNPVEVHYLRVANVQDGYLDLTEMSTLVVSQDEVEKYSVLPGDVLMNEGGDLDKLGRGTIWNGEYCPCIHQNHVFVVRCEPTLAPRFLNIWTGSKYARSYFMEAGKQTTNLASINKSALGRLPVILPSSSEQELVIATYEHYEKRVAVEVAQANKYRSIKQGLMDDLLTGRVRVPLYTVTTA